MVEVVNLRTCKDWGKPGDVRVDRMTKWGNPFHMLNESTRDFVCDLYEDWLDEQIRHRKLNLNELVDAKRLGCWCFGKGSLITTLRGFIPIENIIIGDMVLSHDSKYHKVTNITKTTNAQTIQIKFRGIPEPIVCTPNHKFYIRKRIRIQSNNIRKIVSSDPLWISAKDIRNNENTSNSCGMIVGYPKDIEHICNDTNSLEFWYLVGRYLGDGWIINYNNKSGYIRKDGTQNIKTTCGIGLCTNHKDADILEQKIYKGGFKSNRTKMRTETTFRIFNKSLMQFLSQFGRYSYGKYIPEWCFLLPYEKQQQIINGLIDSDGHIDNKRNVVSIVTVSRLLSFGIARMCRNIFNCDISMCYKKQNDNIYKNRIIKSNHKIYQISWTRSKINKNKHTDNCIWMPFTFIQRGELETVYNLTVEESESYVVNGIAVHNCSPKRCHGDYLKKKIEELQKFPQQTLVI